MIVQEESRPCPMCGVLLTPRSTEWHIGVHRACVAEHESLKRYYRRPRYGARYTGGKHAHSR